MQAVINGVDIVCSVASTSMNGRDTERSTPSTSKLEEKKDMEKEKEKGKLSVALSQPRWGNLLYATGRFTLTSATTYTKSPARRCTSLQKPKTILYQKLPACR